MLRAILNQRGRRLRDLPARAALRLCNQRLVRQFLDRRYDAALDRHRPSLPSLGGVDARIVEALRTIGICTISLADFGIGGCDELIAGAAGLARGFAQCARKRAAAGESFIIVPPEQIVQHAPGIYYFGLHDRLLDIAHAYIGLPPGYDGVTINYTVADGREVSTRMWHRDWEDRRMMKVAIYLNDVDQDGGPFEIITRYDEATRGDEGFFYNVRSDAEIEGLFDSRYRENVVSCTGGKGMMIFTDTARLFHRGKPARSADRMAVFYSYFAERPRHPFFCERTGMTRKDIQRLAEALSERQRRSALWRDRLPLAWRLVPPASL